MHCCMCNALVIKVFLKNLMIALGLKHCELEFL